MRKRAGLVAGLALSVAVVVLATAGLSSAKPKADVNGHHGRGHAYGHTKHEGSDRTHPPGNNGTVKVDGPPWDSAPNNEPHPGCVFAIDFYGFDQGDLYATYTFDLHPPSGRGTIASGRVFIGEDAAGGGRDLDATTGPVDLANELRGMGASAKRNQGYHVFLTVHADGSIGADTKHKVFWISDCTPDSPATTSHHSPARPTQTQQPSGHGSPARPGHVGNARPARPVAGTPAFTG